MPTTFRITGVIAPSGTLQRVRLYNPDGTTLGELALTEEVNGASVGLGAFAGTATLDPSPADTTTLPCEAEGREVSAQTSAAFDASTTVRLSRGAIGFVRGGQWVSLTPGDLAAVPVIRNVSVSQS